MSVTGDHAVRAARTIPPAGLAAYRRFRRSLKSGADERGIVIEPLVGNAIRNAWRDGYWSGRTDTVSV